MIEGGKSAGENTAGKLYTVADIEALPEGERAELIDGEMFMMASPTLTHQDILVGLSSKIWNYIAEHKGECKVLPAPFAVYIANDDRNYVEPDISVICDKEKLDEKGCHGAPDWVIEIVSPSSRHMDYERKLSLYEAAGVREYWIVDSEQRNVTVYNLEHGEEPKMHSFSERVKAGIYEDLFLDFSELE
ncbi:MAG: Uma2 family endonuclease [Lachnospiraceae bacterium]|nr:Uma2 family endonuclease [Lachnospiraceae bacterium]